MSLLVIDGVRYPVEETAVRREAVLVIDDVTEGVMLDESRIADVKATEYRYTLVIEPLPGDPEAYDALYRDLTAPLSTRVFEVPFGQGALRYTARVVSVSDSLTSAQEGREWGALTVELSAQRPQRISGENWEVAW